jgi:hypothetical protein
MTTALQIYQEALDAVSSAVLRQDFAAFLARVDLPYLVRTLKADIVLHTEADLQVLHSSVSQAMAARGVTHYERIAREAVFTRPDRIEGRHFVHILAGEDRITAPWASRQAMVRRPDGWKFTEAQFPFDAEDLPFTDAVLFHRPKDDAALAAGLMGGAEDHWGVRAE